MTYMWNLKYDTNEHIYKTKTDLQIKRTDRQIYIHTHTHTMEYYSAIEKNEILPFAATWMDLEIVKLGEVNQTEKDKYHMISLICGI